MQMANTVVKALPLGLHLGCDILQLSSNVLKNLGFHV